MKNKTMLATFLFGALLVSAGPARACGFFCHIGNLFDCGDWDSCHKNDKKSTPPKPPAPVTQPPPAAPVTQTPPAATQTPTSSDHNQANTSPSELPGHASGTPPPPSGPLVVPTKPAAPPPAGGDSTALVSGGTGGITTNQKTAGGGAAPVYGAKPGGDTIDVGDAAGHFVAMNNGISAADIAKLKADVDPGVREANAHPGLLASAPTPSFEQQLGPKPQEQNIYKTVGAIPGVTEAKSPEAQAALIAKSMMKNRSLGDWAGVVSDANALIALQPNNPGGYMRRAEAFNHLKRYAEAEADALKATQLDPTNADAWKQLAWAQLRQGKFKEAEASASRAIALNPNDAEAYMMRAYAREGLGDLVGRLRDAAMAAMLDARFKSKYEIAKAGGAIFNSEEDDDTLLGVASARTSRKTSPLAVGLGLAALALLLGGGGYGLRRFLKSRAPLANVIPEGQRDGSLPLAAEPRKITTGSILGKYQLGHIVGRGGMGQVFEATDLSLSRPVAVKKMTEQVSQLGPQARMLFLKEARTVAQLHHPSIVEIYDILEEGSDLFMVFELVSGKTAQQLIVESGKLPLAKVVTLLKPVCDALDFAHGRALVHRDLKPGNIMVTDQGHVKLMDFGIARSVGEAAAPAGGGASAGFGRTSIVAGTPEYRAPEAEAGIVCKEGDVYSLGVTVYEMLTGHLPYSPMASAQDKAAQRFAKASALAPGLPTAVDELLSKALQATPERRLKTPGEFIAGLAAALGTPAA